MVKAWWRVGGVERREGERGKRRGEGVSGSCFRQKLGIG